MAKPDDHVKYIYDSLVRIETKIDSFDDKFATKKESNIKTLLVVLTVLLIHGIIMPQDLLSVFNIG